MPITIRTRLAACTFALGLAGAAAWGAYSVAQSAAEQGFARAIERLRAALPPDVTLEHGAVVAEPVSGRITVADLAIGPRDQPRERLRTPRLVIEGIAADGSGAARIATGALTGDIWEGGRPHRLMAADGLTLSGLALPPAGAPLALDRIRLDTLELTGLALTPLDRDVEPSGRIARIGLGGIGGDRPDSLDIEGVDMTGPGLMLGDRLVLARASGRNLRLPALIEALANDRTPPLPADDARLLIEGLAITDAGTPMLALARLLSEGMRIGGDPNNIRGALAIEGLDLSLPRELGPMALGYTRLRLDLALAADTHITAGNVNLRAFRLALPDVGTLEMTLEMTRLGLNAADPMREGRLHGFTVRYTDAGLVARALTQGAQAGGMTAEELRARIEQTAPTLFSGPAAEANLRALRSFLARPTSIGITAAPAAPVGLADLEREGGRAPDAVARLLNITVTSP